MFAYSIHCFIQFNAYSIQCRLQCPLQFNSLAKNVVRMRCAKNHGSGLQRCNWFRSENARENRIRRRSDGCLVMVIARWLFSHLQEIETRFVLVISGSYSLDNLASRGSLTNAAGRFIFLQSTSEDAASPGKMAQKR